MTTTPTRPRRPAYVLLNPDAADASPETLARILALVTPFAQRYAFQSEADLEHPSIEAWIMEATAGEAGYVARYLAGKFELRELEVREIITRELRSRFTARRVAALPSALRSIFRDCGNPTFENVMSLIERVPEEERGGWTVNRAMRRVWTCIQSQQAMQRQRFAQEARP